MTVRNSSTITGNTAPLGFGADVFNAGVLHLDSHYDTLASVLNFESVRLDRG